MSAYELAKKWELSLDVWDDRDYTSWCYDASSMLRQQADRIAELEVILKKEGISVGHDLLKGGIAILKKNQELSDEEIDDIWAGCSTGNDVIDMHQFARAIIKASRGEE